MSKYHAVSSGMVTRQALPSITRQRGTTTGSANLMLYGAGKTTVSNNTTFIDSSANAFTVTRNGDTVQSGFNPFSQASSGSGYFDGTGDYLTVPANAAFNFGTGNFTVEAWIYITGNAALNGNGVREAAVFNVGSTAFTTGFSLSIVGNSTTTGTGLGIYKNLNTETSISATTTITQNAWHHIAVTRSGSSVYLFLDGTQVGSTGTSSTIWGSTTEGVLVGRLWSGTSYLNDFPGYISNLRIVKGTAIYTANFTPPTSPLTAKNKYTEEPERVTATWCHAFCVIVVVADTVVSVLVFLYIFKPVPVVVESPEIAKSAEVVKDVEPILKTVASL